jgi:uncharacterized repeat protein (TIGR01451 family)
MSWFGTIAQRGQGGSHSTNSRKARRSKARRRNCLFESLEQRHLLSVTFLDIEDNDSLAAPQVLTSPGLPTGTIVDVSTPAGSPGSVTASDPDFYQFQAVVNGELNLSVGFVGATGSVTVQLYKSGVPDGGPTTISPSSPSVDLSRAIDGGTHLTSDVFQIGIEGDGQYQLRVWNPDLPDSGGSHDDTLATANLLGVYSGTPLSSPDHTITRPDRDYFEFESNVTGWLEARIVMPAGSGVSTGPNGPTNLGVRVRDASGTILATSNAAASNVDIAGFHAMAGDTYFVEVYSGSLGQVNTYDLEIGAPTSTVSGFKYHDRNEDGFQDWGEEGLSDWRIYSDLNGSGEWDSGEPYATTDANGYYELTLGPGLHRIREEAQSGWLQSFPGADADYSHTILLSSSSVLDHLDFGNYRARPNIEFSKTGTFDAGADGFAQPGELISYTFVVTNTGNVTLDGVTVSDPLPGLSAIVPAGVDGLAPGASATFTATYAVTQADIDAGSVYNEATADSDESEPATDDHTESLSQNPSLMIDKAQTGGPNPVTAAGEVLQYTIVIENTGNVSQTGVSVSDVLPDGTAGTLTGPVESVDTDGVLQVGETWTYTVSYTVTQDDVDAGDHLVNTAGVATTQVPEPIEDDAITPVAQSPSLAIEKTQTGGPNPVTAAAQVLHYTIVVENTGNVSQTGVNASDVLPDGTAGALTGPVESTDADGVLQVGETWTYTISYTVTQADVDAGDDLVNTASVTTTQVPDPISDDATTPVTQSPSLTIDKTQAGGPNPVTAAGQVLQYAILIENTGNVSQTEVSVSDVLPDGSAGTLAGPVESVDTDGVLQVGETWTYTVSYTVTQGDVDAGDDLVNTASVVTTQVPVSTEDDAITPVEQAPSLTIDKTQTGGANPVTAAGQVLQYAIAIENTGNVSQTGVAVSDVLPDGSAGTLAGPVESLDSDGVLQVGETWIYTVSYMVTQADVDAGNDLVNMASVVTTQIPVSTEDDAVTPVEQAPSLTIDKTQTGGPNPVTAAGQGLHYAIAIENTGNVSHTGVSVSDVLPDGSAGTLTGPVESLNADGVLQVGETWTYTISYTVTQADVDAGDDLVNTASVVTTRIPEPTEDDATTPVQQSPSLTIDKTQAGGPSPVTAAGQVLQYTIAIENTGNVSQTGVSVSDVLPDGSAGTLAGPVESVDTDGVLQVGETWTYTVSYTVTQADVDAGDDLVNAASVVTTQVPGPTGDDATTPVAQSPSLTIDKTQTGGPNPVTAADQVLQYTVAIENTGNVSQTGVSVSDVLPDGSAGTLAGPVESLDSDGVLQVGETWTYTVSYTVTQDDVDAGDDLVNTAGVTTTQVPEPTQDDAITPIVQTLGLTIEKTQSGGPNPVTAAGQVLQYAIVLENTGDVSQTGVSVNDLLPDGSGGTLTGPVESQSTDGVLQVGETWTYTVSYTVTQDDVDAGDDLVNTAGVTTTQVPVPIEDAAITPVAQSPSLTIDKTQTGGPNPVTTAGQVLQYTIVVENTGNTRQTGVNVSDVLPNGSAGTLAGPVESLDADGVLQVGETWTYAVSYAVTQDDVDAGDDLVNTAAVTTTQVPEPIENEAITPVAQSPSLTVDKTQTGGPNPVTAAGQVLQYTIVVENTGNVSQTGVNVSDVLPDGSAGATVGPVESLDTDGVLQVGESWTYTISYTVTQADVDAGDDLINRASITTDQSTAPESDDATTEVQQNAAVAIEKSTNSMDADTAPGVPVVVGSAVVWTYAVTNTGNVTLSSVAVSDDQGVTISGPAGDNGNGVLDPGETWTYTAGDLATGGQYANVGSVTAVGPGGQTVGDTDPSHYFGVQAAIRVEKSTNGEDADVPPGPTLIAGLSTVTWTYVVTNPGNFPLSDVVLADDNGTPGNPLDFFNPTYLSGDANNNDLLDPGETWLYQASAIAQTGQYSNMVTATGTAAAVSQTVVDMDRSHYLGLPPDIGGRKVHDVNGNGVIDAGDVPLAGWTIQLYRDNGDGVFEPNSPFGIPGADGDPVQVAVTDANGNYYFVGLTPGVYFVREVQQQGWGQVINPGAGLVVVHTVSFTGSTVLGLDFANTHCNDNLYQVSADVSQTIRATRVGILSIEVAGDAGVSFTVTREDINDTSTFLAMQNGSRQAVTAAISRPSEFHPGASRARVDILVTAADVGKKFVLQSVTNAGALPTLYVVNAVNVDTSASLALQITGSVCSEFIAVRDDDPTAGLGVNPDGPSDAKRIFIGMVSGLTDGVPETEVPGLPENSVPLGFEGIQYNGAIINTMFSNPTITRVEINAGAGNDIVRVGDEITQQAVINGGDGDDIIRGGAGKATISGAAGDDFLVGGDADDIIYGGDGRDSIHGGEGADRIDGGRHNDWIAGGRGDDPLLRGGDGDDRISGGAGRDRLYGDANNTASPGDVAYYQSADLLVSGFETKVLVVSGPEDTLEPFLLALIDRVWNDHHAGDGIDTLDELIESLLP